MEITFLQTHYKCFRIKGTVYRRFSKIIALCHAMIEPDLFMSFWFVLLPIPLLVNRGLTNYISASGDNNNNFQE
jgi:hypothetical protein